ncbi:hypothetical protein SDC9_139092 [bioreactor metagenome]|uniref:Uncharacterized protein n=1 Tax=bioreactor metagenome TaxID=1076179 RepID=A0A645DS62_9ZZZZ
MKSRRINKKMLAKLGKSMVYYSCYRSIDRNLGVKRCKLCLKPKEGRILKLLPVGEGIALYVKEPE